MMDAAWNKHPLENPVTYTDNLYQPPDYRNFHMYTPGHEFIPLAPFIGESYGYIMIHLKKISESVFYLFLITSF